jgi:hypothetical protein
MTTTAVSTTKSINVTGIGPVELTVEERVMGRPFWSCMAVQVRSRSPDSPSRSPGRVTTGY